MHMLRAQYFNPTFPKPNIEAKKFHMENTL